MPDQTARQVLTIDTGPSGPKVALYEAGRDETRILSGEVERIGVPGGRSRDGAVPPVFHLNGYKVSEPTVMGRDRVEDVRKLLEAHGYEVHRVEGGRSLAHAPGVRRGPGHLPCHDPGPPDRGARRGSFEA